MARNRVLRKTKVIATIGPSCDSLETLKAMIRAGMNVARLNFSHGTHEEHQKRLQCIRQAAHELTANIATMLDTKGVEIRTGRVEGGSATLTTGEEFLLYTGDRLGNAQSRPRRNGSPSHGRRPCLSTPRARSVARPRPGR